MKTSMSQTLPHRSDAPPSILSQPGPACVAVAVVALFAVHLALFAIGTAPLAGDAINSLNGNAMLARFAALVFALIAILMMMRTISARTGSVITAATLPLGLSIFPPAVYEFATDPLTAAVLAVSLIGAACTLASRIVSVPRELAAGAVTGAAIGGMPWLHISGAVLGMALFVLALAERRSPRYWIALAAGMACLIIAGGAGLTFAGGASGVAEPHVGPLRSFAMLWLALAFSGVALALSRTLRAKVSAMTLRRAVAALAAVAVCGVWFVIVRLQGGANIAEYLPPMLGIGLLACAPLVLWIELVMPAIRSVWIWILLPVTMYSCFWVVLGPIDLDAFPYTELTRFRSD